GHPRGQFRRNGPKNPSPGPRGLPDPGLGTAGRAQGIRQRRIGNRRFLWSGTPQQHPSPALPVPPAELCAQPRLADPRLSRDHHEAPGPRAGQRQDTAELTHLRVTTHHRGRLSDHRDTLPGLALPTRMIDRPAPTRMISASVTFTRAEDVRASATGPAFANASPAPLDLGTHALPSAPHL